MGKKLETPAYMGYQRDENAADKREDVVRVQSVSEAGIRLELLGFVDFPAGHRGAEHFHPFWEVIFIGGGKGIFHRGAEVEPCGKNEIILIRPGESHQIEAGDSESMQQFYFGFSFDFTPMNALTWTAPATFPPGPLLELIRSELRVCHDRLRIETNSQALEIVRARLMPVVSRMVGFLVSPGRESDHRRKASPVQLVKEFLHANLRSHVTVKELAQRFSLSPPYFGEIFKKETGLSIKEYQTRIRIHRAQELIRQSDQTITSIAEEVGLDDLAYFSRLFKKEYHLSPRQLRQRDQGHTGAGPD